MSELTSKESSEDSSEDSSEETYGSRSRYILDLGDEFIKDLKPRPNWGLEVPANVQADVQTNETNETNETNKADGVGKDGDADGDADAGGDAGGYAGGDVVDGKRVEADDTTNLLKDSKMETVADFLKKLRFSPDQQIQILQPCGINHHLVQSTGEVYKGLVKDLKEMLLASLGNQKSQEPHPNPIHWKVIVCEIYCIGNNSKDGHICPSFDNTSLQNMVTGIKEPEANRWFFQYKAPENNSYPINYALIDGLHRINALAAVAGGLKEENPDSGDKIDKVLQNMQLSVVTVTPKDGSSLDEKIFLESCYALSMGEVSRSQTTNHTLLDDILKVSSFEPFESMEKVKIKLQKSIPQFQHLHDGGKKLHSFVTILLSDPRHKHFFMDRKVVQSKKAGKLYNLLSATFMTGILAHPPLGDNIKAQIVTWGQQLPEDTYCEFLPFNFQTNRNLL